MAESVEKILSTSEKELPRKPDQNPNEKYIQRTITMSRDGSEYKIVSEIIQTKIKKSLPKAVIEHMKWPKFGIPAGQPRGSLEPGIIEVSNEEIHIQDRDNTIEQDLGEKIRDSINSKKDAIIKEMEAKRKRENEEKLEAFKNRQNEKEFVTKLKKEYAAFRQVRDEMQELLVAQKNIESLYAACDEQAAETKRQTQQEH